MCMDCLISFCFDYCRIKNVKVCNEKRYNIYGSSVLTITLLNESKDHGLIQIKEMKQKFESSIK